MINKLFAKAVLFSVWKGTPPSYVFTDPNRAAFNTYVNTLKGETPADDLMIKHYRDMNTYCDQEKVTMMPQERTYLQNALKPGTQVKVSDLLAGENAMFKSTAANFPEDSLDYVLRGERPDYLAQYFPGTLNIKK